MTSVYTKPIATSQFPDAAPSSTLAAPAPRLPLRPYQHEAIAALDEARRAGRRRVLCVLPTGTGKTVIFAEYLRQQRGRSVILVHRDELIRQAVGKLRMADPSARVGIVKADENDVDADVIVASVQTVCRPERLAQLPLDLNTLVIDEAHHASAPSYRTVLQHLGAFEPAGPFTVGFTATPDRSEVHGLGDVFETVAFERGMVPFIRAGYLADIRAVQVKLKASFARLRTRAGDFIERELETLLTHADAEHYAVAAYKRYASGRKALVFTPTVATACRFAQAFLSAGIPAEAIDGSTPLLERRAVLRRFAEGETHVIANCAVLTEGFDDPSVDCVIIARPTKSTTLYRQMIGRGTRPHPDKDDLLVVDLVGATHRHDLVTTASLFAVDPRQLATDTLTAVLDKENARRAKKQARTSPKQPPQAGEVVGEYVDVLGRNRLRWLMADGRHYVALGNQGFVALVPNEGRFRVEHRRPNGQIAVLADGLDLGFATGVAEDFVRSHQVLHLADRNARWRSQPVTERQRVALQRCGISTPRNLTRGQASDLIAKAQLQAVGM